MVPKKIEAFVTSDGELFIDVQDATAHENNLARKRNVREFWEAYGWSGMTASDAESITLENFRELREILK